MQDRNSPQTQQPASQQLPQDFESSPAPPAAPELDSSFASPAPAHVLRELRAFAKEWWYHAELRQRGQHAEAFQREHASIRSSLAEIRATLANDGWLSVGRGGATLHYSPNAHVEGLHPQHIRACIAAGIPTLDSTGMDIKDVYELAVRGPMAGFVDSAFGPDLDGSLSTRQWRVIFDRYAARPGAVFHNYTPNQTPCHPLSEAAPELKEEGISAFEAKQERRRQRLLDRAERHESLAENSEAAADQIADSIPLGQPILVGHHSEKSDRSRRGRMQRLYERAHEASESAEELHRRAEAVGTAGISADDPRATEKLDAKAADLEVKRETMKRANAHWKAKGTLDGFDELDAEEKASALRGMQLMGAAVPFPGYALRNIGARIRTAKARTEEILTRDEAESQELTGRGLRIFEDRLDNRLLIEFEKKPSPEICQMLHRAGFHWARSRGTWSRQLTNAAWASAHNVAGKLAENSIPDADGDDR